MKQRRPPDEPAFARPPESEIDALGDRRPPFRGGGSVVPWILLVLVVVGAGLGALLLLVPLHAALHTAEQQLEEARAATLALQGHVEQLTSAKRAVEAARDALAREVEGKEQDLQELQRTDEELAHTLREQMQSGDVAIRHSHGELVVDLVDKILFESGEAAVTASGKQVLRTVADSLVKVSGRVIDVRGHTDTLPVAGKLTRQFATNWELSTQRATNVVRFLQESCAVPGERLIASGFSQYRPVSTNASKTGRARNRRIEVVLLP